MRPAFRLTPASRPNTFILGAPKCGTSALFHWLTEHPQVFGCNPKEPRFFCRSSLQSSRVKTVEAYEHLFRHAGESAVVMEGTTYYMLDETALPKILAYAPSARFIALLRNPVEMAVSWHGECVRSSFETLLFEDAWRAVEERREGHSIPLGCPDPILLDYPRICSIGAQLQRVLQQVPKRQLHVAFLDDFEREPRAAWRDLLTFLDLPDDGRRSFPRINEGYLPRRPTIYRLIDGKLPRIRRRLRIRHPTGMATKLARFLGGISPRAVLSPDVQEDMRKWFADDIALVGELTGRDLRSWLLPVQGECPSLSQSNSCADEP